MAFASDMQSRHTPLLKSIEKLTNQVQDIGDAVNKLVQRVGNLDGRIRQQFQEKTNVAEADESDIDELYRQQLEACKPKELRTSAILSRSEIAKASLRQVFPKPIYWFLVISGTIGVPCNCARCPRPCQTCVRLIIPILYLVLSLVVLLMTLATTMQKLVTTAICVRTAGCWFHQSGDFFEVQRALINFIMACVSIVATLNGVFVFPKVLRSNEVQCLLRFAGPCNIRRNWGTGIWRKLLISCFIGWLFYILAMVTVIYTTDKSVFIYYSYAWIMFLPILSAGFVVGPIKSAIDLAWADVARKILRHRRGKAEDVEDAMIEHFQQVVSLSSQATRVASRAIMLHSILLFCYVFNFFYQIQLIINSDVPDKLPQVIRWVCDIFFLGFMFGIPLIVAVVTSSRAGILDRMLDLVRFPKLSHFVHDSAKEWMLSHDSALTWDFVFKILFSLGFLSVLIKQWGGYAKHKILIGNHEWKSQYEEYGTCNDNVWSGSEQNVDCGGLESGCKPCIEKYKTFMLIGRNRSCNEVDGYEPIQTQRLCEVGYVYYLKSTRFNNKRNVSATVFANSTSNGVSMRCGAHKMKNKLEYIHLKIFNHYLVWTFPSIYFSDENTASAGPQLCVAPSRLCKDASGLVGPVPCNYSIAQSNNTTKATQNTHWVTRSQPWAQDKYHHNKHSVQKTALNITHGSPECVNVEFDNSKSSGATATWDLVDTCPRPKPGSSTSAVAGKQCPAMVDVQLRVANASRIDENVPQLRVVRTTSENKDVDSLVANVVKLDGNVKSLKLCCSGSRLVFIADYRAHSLNFELCVS